MKFICVAGASVNQTPLDWKGNLDHLLEAVSEAKAKKVDLLCLPELSICGYGCEDTYFSNYILENSIQSLVSLAKKCDDITVSVGLPISYENCLYNATAIIHNTKIVGFVAKQDLAGDGIHYEPRWFKKWPKDQVAHFVLDGNRIPLGDIIFEIDGVRFGFEICEDAWNGVRPAQDHYLGNVDVILNPSASHFAFGKSKVRELLVTETSRAFSCAYVYSNLLGNEAGRVIYDGEILISQGGNLLAKNRRFSFTDVQVVHCLIDIEAIRRQKKKSFNFSPVPPQNLVLLNGVLTTNHRLDIQINIEKENLNKEQEFYAAVSLGLFDYMRKSKSRGFVVSLSGGADSSACSVLCAASFSLALAQLGEEGFIQKTSHIRWEGKPTLSQYLTCIYQGTENSSEATFMSAKGLAEDLGSEFHYWNVQPFFGMYKALAEHVSGRELSWETDDIVLQNVQARMRAPGVWMIANLQQALLITTSNRSESAVGYATMDGDTAGGLMPLGGIDKTFLLSWLQWAEKELKIRGLDRVNALKPTAELRPGTYHQSDEDDLMPYSVLNQIEKCAILDYKSPVEVFLTLRGIAEDEILKAWIRKFFTLWARNQWKRERYAPSFHLDDENLDPKTWCRFPILNGGYLEALTELERFS